MNPRPAPELFVVDDDADVRDLLSVVFSSAGYRPTCFAEGDSFVAEARHRMPACVLLDIFMPGRSGLDILSGIDAPRFGAPILVMSARCEIPVAVDAVKRGAVDFIEKPCQPGTMLARVRAAIDEWGRVPALCAPRFPRQELLTPREHDVLARLVSGDSNKEAARQLGISPRTVEVHRFRIMEKLQAKNALDLMRIVLG